MRSAILADIHANLEALTAVLGDIEQKGGVDEYWCLGDIVGYGPEPHACIELLRRYNHVAVAGNHDRGAIGKLGMNQFNPHAQIALAWTAEHLTEEDSGYLGSLPLTLDIDEFLLAHGSPADPLLEYVTSTGIATRNFAFLRSPFCLVGHSHVPAVFMEESGTAAARSFSPGVGLVLGKSRMVINPGSVGQPRDGDPQAAYAIYDSESGVIRLYRVPYDIEATYQRIMQTGLPLHLAIRLKEGR